MARFFIDRPVFAWVLAIIAMLAGVLSLMQLPVSMYPTIAPPQINVRAIYPGASAKVVQDSVTQVIEQSMKGLDGMVYMSSNSSANGIAQIAITFQNGTNPDTAQVQVQNKLQTAMPLLPQEVQRQGVNVSKSTTGFLQVLSFVATDGSMDRDDIADYVTSTLVDPLSRTAGVGDMTVFGAKYAMRIWLDAEKLHSYRLTPGEVIAAIQGQNAQVALGQLGGAPAVAGQQLNATISLQDRLQTPEQFRNVIVRTNTDASVVRLGDVARVAIGSENYDFLSRYNGQPAVGVAMSLATGANALDTSRAVDATLESLQASMPPGLEVKKAFDTVPFVRVAVSNVITTLLEAVALVFLVMYLFLQNWRATLIPTIAVPVVLLGTMAVLAAFGMSINMLTMFAMVLAIGLLVDDAIVVVENVERVMHEQKLSALEATRRSMDQISGALVGIGLVLAAVFVPMAFMTGSTGVIYRQFSVTIVSAMALSVLVALILTPALCATMLKGHDDESSGGRAQHKGLLGRFFAWFNDRFNRTSAGYQRGVKGMLARKGRFMLVYVALVAVMGVLFMRLPASFLPEEDQGVLFVMVQGPAGSTQERTVETLRKVEDYFLNQEKDAVQSVMSVQGFSFAGMGQNTGIAFVRLKDWSERHSKELGVQAVAHRGMGAMMQIKDAMVFVFAPPAMPELGTSSGFAFFLKDEVGLGHEALLQARNQLLGMASQSPLLAGVRPNGQEDTPQFRVQVDRERATAQGLNMAQVNQTLAVAWGGQYIDDFLDRGRIKRVYVQGEAEDRMLPTDFSRWTVKNAAGDMVQFDSFASSEWTYGPQRLERYNATPAKEIQGQGAPGVSSGVAMAEIEKLAAQLPKGFTVDWTGLSYQERQAGQQTTLLYALSLAIVFLCLAALYESWSVPTAVLLVAPLGILGATLANTIFGMSRDVYFQVAMLTTVGLTSKNGILIVEFAKENYDKGMALVDATLRAVGDRLRPIIMTSFAFGLGVLPLAIATGAGSGAQRAIGTGVVGGMLVGTTLGLFFIPLFYVAVTTLVARFRPTPKAVPAVDTEEAVHGTR